MPILIKRYRNRKLYDTQGKRYITLGGIGGLINDGEEITVVDNQTGNDITATILSQLILSLEKNQAGRFPVRMLSLLMQSAGQRIEDFRWRFLSQVNLTDLHDKEIQRRINLLIDDGKLSKNEGHEILELLISANAETSWADEINEKIALLLKRHQIPTRSELLKLQGRIDEISHQFFEVETVELKKK